MRAQQILASGASAIKTLTYQTNSGSSSAGTVFTFPSQAIGTATADRRVIVAYMGSFGAGLLGVPTVTVGDTNAPTRVSSLSADSRVGICIVLKISGTTADVVVTWDKIVSNCAIGVWSCTGLSSNNTIDTDSSLANPGTATLSSSGNGFCVSAGMADGSVATAAWSGGIDEQFEILPSDMLLTGASAMTLNPTVSPSCSYTSGGSIRKATVFATW